MQQEEIERLATELIQCDSSIVTLREKLVFARGGNELLLIAQRQLQDRLLVLDDEIETLNKRVDNTRNKLGSQRSELEEKNSELRQNLIKVKEATVNFQERLAGLAQRIALDSILSRVVEIRSRSGSLSLIVGEADIFRRNSSRLEPAAGPVLSSIARILEAEPLLDLLIIGHTDNSNRYAAQGGNRAFSAQRAVSLADELSGKYFLSANRINAAGMGDAAPLQSNATEAGRTANRRIEFQITNSVVNLLRDLEKITGE